jgi:hypothetical protein
MYENTGRLFKNTYKQPGDNKPDYTGDFTDAAGNKMRLAAWIKNTGQGPWLSIKVSEPQQQQPAQSGYAPAAAPPSSSTEPPAQTVYDGPDDDSEMPF